MGVALIIAGMVSTGALGATNNIAYQGNASKADKFNAYAITANGKPIPLDYATATSKTVTVSVNGKSKLTLTGSATTKIAAWFSPVHYPTPTAPCGTLSCDGVLSSMAMWYFPGYSKSTSSGPTSIATLSTGHWALCYCSATYTKSSSSSGH